MDTQQSRVLLRDFVGALAIVSITVLFSAIGRYHSSPGTRQKTGKEIGVACKISVYLVLLFCFCYLMTIRMAI